MIARIFVSAAECCTEIVSEKKSDTVSMFLLFIALLVGPP